MESFGKSEMLIHRLTEKELRGHQSNPVFRKCAVCGDQECPELCRCDRCGLWYCERHWPLDKAYVTFCPTCIDGPAVEVLIHTRKTDEER